MGPTCKFSLCLLILGGISQTADAAEKAEPLRLSLTLSSLSERQLARRQDHDAVSQTKGSLPAGTSGSWHLNREDRRLDIALNRWAEAAGYAVRWDADRCLLIGAETVFYGTFEEAVYSLLATPGIRHSEYPLEACLYDNSPPLLRITKLGDQSEACQ